MNNNNRLNQVCCCFSRAILMVKSGGRTWLLAMEEQRWLRRRRRRGTPQCAAGRRSTEPEQGHAGRKNIALQDCVLVRTADDGATGGISEYLPQRIQENEEEEEKTAQKKD